MISKASLFLNFSIFFSNLICSRNLLCFSACSFLTSACSNLINFCNSSFLTLVSSISSFNSCCLALNKISFSNLIFLWASFFSFSIVWIFKRFCLSLSSWMSFVKFDILSENPWKKFWSDLSILNLTSNNDLNFSFNFKA